MEWRLVQITSRECPRDGHMEEIIRRFKEDTDNKYNRVLFRFPRKLTHPDRFQETELGDLFADILGDALKPDIMLVGSGSLRKYSLPPILTIRDFMEFFTYENSVLQLSVTGAQLRRMFGYMLRDEMFRGERTEFFQVSRNLRLIYDRASQELILTFRGGPVDDARLYTVGLQAFAADNFQECFGFPLAEVKANKAPRVLATSDRDVIFEFFQEYGIADIRLDGRITIINDPAAFPVHDNNIY